MRWFKPNMRSSFYALLARIHPPEPESTVLEYSVEGIRESMLELVGDAPETLYRHIGRRIRYAGDVHALWYLRGDLMALLAGRHGEAVAREKIEMLTEMFEDFLPQGLKSRPSPLHPLPKND
ncbi:MAG: hypothetical protein H7322_18035 [Ramlibacter sp.]|nr:hypothetical protein [Ramlibacter sp.]